MPLSRSQSLSHFLLREEKKRDILFSVSQGYFQITHRIDANQNF
jgi:hypothetical protein